MTTPRPDGPNLPPNEKIQHVLAVLGDYYGDFTLIQRDLGWAPKVSLSGGLKKTVDFYRQHAKHYWE